MHPNLPSILLNTLPAVYSSGPDHIWFGAPAEPPFLGFSLGPEGLWSEWSLGERANDMTWHGAMREADVIEKSLVLSEGSMIRHTVRPGGSILIPFYLADRSFLLPVDQGGPSIDGFTMGSVEYGDHGVVPAAYRDGELFSVGGCALPSMLKASTFPVEQFYEELASPEGGEIFMINPRSPDRP